MGDATGLALSEDLVVRDGGWDPRFARVLLIEQSGAHALALVDGNGDGTELELEYWQRDAGDNWSSEASSGFSSLDSISSEDAWDAGDLVCAVGRVTPDTVVRIRYGDRIYSRRSNSIGIWGFIREADSPHVGELPAIAADNG